MQLELPKSVAANIDRFTGRTWLLPTVLEWFEQTNDRLFILTGEPGTGKSMIAAWLAGSGPASADTQAAAQLEQIRAHVKAVHFCQARGGNTAPNAFAQSLAEQLTRSFPGFAQALAGTLADRVQLLVTQDVGRVESGRSVTGIAIRAGSSGLTPN